MQDRVLNILEHMLNVLRVDGRGEVMKQWLAALSSPRVKQVTQEALHIVQTAWVTIELWEVLADVNRAYFLLKQVHLVEEENDRDCREASIVDDGLEDVARFHQAVGLAVLHQNL